MSGARRSSQRRASLRHALSLLPCSMKFPASIQVLYIAAVAVAEASLCAKAMGQEADANLLLPDTCLPQRSQA